MPTKAELEKKIADLDRDIVSIKKTKELQLNRILELEGTVKKHNFSEAEAISALKKELEEQKKKFENRIENRDSFIVKMLTRFEAIRALMNISYQTPDSNYNYNRGVLGETDIKDFKLHWDKEQH